MVSHAELLCAVVDGDGRHVLKEKWRTVWKPFDVSHSSPSAFRKYATVLDDVISLQSQIQCHAFHIPSDYPIHSEGMRRYVGNRNISLPICGGDEKKESGVGEEREGEKEDSLFRLPTPKEYETPNSFEGLFYTHPLASSREGGSKLILCIHGGPHR
jgi:hypothetical protein